MAFSVTVTSPMKGAERISRSVGVYAGKVSIASYSQTLVECTAVTRHFVPTSNSTTGGFTHGIMSVQIDGPSSSGYLVNWDYTTGAFKCFYSAGSTSPSVTLVASATVSAAGVPLLWNATTGAGLLGSTAADAGSFTVNTPVNRGSSQAVADATIGTFGFIAIGLIR